MGQHLRTANMAERWTAGGKPLTAEAVGKGLRLNILAASMGSVWMVIVGGMPLTMFMKEIGASGVMIGLAGTVQQIATVLQVPAALLAERITRRKPFWVVLALIHRLLWFLPALLPLYLGSHSPHLALSVVAVMGVSGIFAQLGVPVWWSWLADLVPAERRGGFWAMRHSVASIASLAGILLSGVVLDAFSPEGEGVMSGLKGFVIVFSLAAFLGSADILVHLWIPEPKAGGGTPAAGILSKVWAPFANRDFLWLTLAMGLWTFSVGLVGQFGLIYLRDEFGIGYSAMASLMVAGTLGASVAGILWGYVIDRVGARNFGAIMMIVAPLCGGANFFLRDTSVTVPVPFLHNPVVYQPLLILVIGSFFGGLLYSGVGLSQISLLSALSSTQGRTMAMAVHWSAVGLLGAAGPLLGGRAMDWLQSHPVGWVMPTGTRFAFFHALIVLQVAVVWMVAVRLMLQIRQREGEMAFRAALSSLQFSNPVRLLTGIYNIYTMLSSTSRGGRAEAARRVGEERLRIAVRDLIAQLDDPSADVREEAAIALGRIGSPDAVEALIERLNDPDADIAPQIARALRHSHSRQAVESLIRRLGDADRETVAESARALGEIGDERARGPLLKVLQESGDEKVVSASGEALARLGEMAALCDIIPRMNETRNPVLKRSLAVAAGDLLGKPGEFYRLLVKEQRLRGSACGQMIDEIKASLEEAGDAIGRERVRILQEKVEGLRGLYAAGEYRKAVEVLFDLALSLAAIRYGILHGADATALVETIVWFDARFGVGTWYLELLREAGEKGSGGDGTEILLGLHVLSGWRPHGTPVQTGTGAGGA